jgi:PAS domain S-box-containing protein
MSGDVHAIMWSLDLDTYRYLSVNDGLVELLGYNREELLRMTIFDMIAPEDRERLQKHLPERPSTGDVGEWILRRKNGSRVAVHIRFHDVELGAHRVSFRYATKVREVAAPHPVSPRHEDH